VRRERTPELARRETDAFRNPNPPAMPLDNIETLKKFPITLTELTSVTRQLVVLIARAKKSTVEAPFRM